MLSAGLVIGVMIIPLALSVRMPCVLCLCICEGSYDGGTACDALRVVLPAAISGICAAYILGISAVGETMVVAIAAGQPNLTLNPMDEAATIAYIVSVGLGDLPHGSLEYQPFCLTGTDDASLQHLGLLPEQALSRIY